MLPDPVLGDQSLNSADRVLAQHIYIDAVWTQWQSPSVGAQALAFVEVAPGMFICRSSCFFEWRRRIPAGIRASPSVNSNKGAVAARPGSRCCPTRSLGTRAALEGRRPPQGRSCGDGDAQAPRGEPGPPTAGGCVDGIEWLLGTRHASPALEAEVHVLFLETTTP